MDNLAGVVAWLRSVFGFPLQFAISALFTALIFAIHRSYPWIFGRLAGWSKEIRPVTLILATALLPVALRLAALPLAPAPQPYISDEFSHLLQADTLLAGRFTNPPHPLARHFETAYVLQRPTYASIYPIGQGIVLAAGSLLTGNAWAGVLLSLALMTGASTWMLLGCLSPRWAAFGGFLAGSIYGLSGEWINSYWGGAFCAFGGALLFGALLRIRKAPSKRLALLAGLGWSIVWLTRPFESLPLFLFLWAFVAACAFAGNWKRWIGPACALTAVLLAAGGLTIVRDRAVTGSFMTLPYQLSQRIDGVPQSLWGQAPIPEPKLDADNLKNMYAFQRKKKDFMELHPFRHYWEIAYNTWHFFVRWWLSLPIALALLAGGRATRYWAALIACSMAVSGFYAFFFPHYLAAYVCIFALLSVRGLYMISRLRIGPMIVCFLTLGAAATNLGSFGPYDDRASAALRSQVAAQVSAVPGRHVIFVHYLPGHDLRDEWVYNRANVDASRIVWSTDMGPEQDRELAHYYPHRELWIADFDGHSADVHPYKLAHP